MDKDAELAALSAMWAKMLADGETLSNAPPGPIASMLDRVHRAFLGDSQALEALERARRDGTTESVDSLAGQLALHAARDRGLAAHLLEFRALLGEDDDGQDPVTEPEAAFHDDGLTMPTRVTCSATAYWLWFNRFGTVVLPVAGAVALIAAAAAHNARTSPTLVLFGVLWLVGGIATTRQFRRGIQEITIDGDLIEFTSPARTFTVPASDIIRIKSPPALLDPQSMQYLRIRTRSHGVIKIAPRMDGLTDVLAALYRANPDVKW